MTVAIFDDRACVLGEGALWHPGRGRLYWFDIDRRRLLGRDGAGPREWAFAEQVSAAGWIDDERLLVASETALLDFDLTRGEGRRVAALDAGNPATRSNDGRADPRGGFWIGTMGKGGARGMGAIWRWHRGELRRLFAPVSIPNALCFDPAGGWAQFADTATGAVMRVALDGAGWPRGEPEVFLDLAPLGLKPDGAVVDALGATWIALWGGGGVASWGPDGSPGARIALPARQVTCPAFGGAGMATLYATSARVGLGDRAGPHDGATFALSGCGRGLPEPRVEMPPPAEPDGAACAS